MITILGGEKFKFIEVFPKIMTVPDSFVVRNNKIQTIDDKHKESHGEAKLYITSKDKMREFYGAEGFNAKCFLLKDDLINYQTTLKEEYLNPSQNYRGMCSFPELWKVRMKQVMDIKEEVILFDISDQKQIVGNRGYVNSSDMGYKLIRELSLPLVSYILVKKVTDSFGNILFYWKLFVDFDAIQEMKSVLNVFSYGKRKNTKSDNKNIIQDIEMQKIRQGRDG